MKQFRKLKNKLRKQQAKPSFFIDPIVAQKFNAYALAAHPNEIGGLLRVVTDKRGRKTVVDIKIFPHIASNSGYFELDSASVAKFNMDLVKSGRKQELRQWCCLIHSHPNMSSFMSGTDEVNLVRLAGNNSAYSLIVSTSKNPEKNYHRLFYAEGGVSPKVLSDVPFAAKTKESLAGTKLLTAQQIDDIARHTKSALSNT